MKKSLLIISILSMLIGCSVETTVNYNSDSSKDNTSTTGGNTSGSGNNDTNDSDDGEKEIITEFRDGVTLWEGSIDYKEWDTDSAIKIDGIMFKTFKAGDQIQITHESSKIFSEKYQLILSTTNSEWGETILFRGKGINCSPDSSKGLEPYTANQTTVYTLTENDITNLCNQGLVIWGAGLVIKKLVFSCETPISFKLLGMNYKTNYTCTFNGEEYPVFITFETYDGEWWMHDGTSYDSVYVLRFSAWDAPDTGYYGGFKNPGDLIEMFSNETVLNNTIPEDLISENAKYSISYTKDLQTLTIKNVISNNVYTFQMFPKWAWLD